MNGGKKEACKMIDLRKKMKRNPDHCCEKMQWYLEEQKAGIYYNPILREYYIRLRSYRDGKCAIFYCPWCGYSMKPSLIDKYYSILRDEYNIEYEPYDNIYYEIVETKDESWEEVNRRLPKEFKTDEWWKKRDL